MRSAHMFDVPAQYSVRFVKYVKNMGVRGTIQFICETMAAAFLNASRAKAIISSPLQIRQL